MKGYQYKENLEPCPIEPVPNCDICGEQEQGTIEDHYGGYTFNVCTVCIEVGDAPGGMCADEP